MKNISVLILMGSDSDAPVMQGAADILTEFQIPWEMTVASAHRSPERATRLVAEAPGRGVKVFIVGAVKSMIFTPSCQTVTCPLVADIL